MQSRDGVGGIWGGFRGHSVMMRVRSPASSEKTSELYYNRSCVFECYQLQVLIRTCKTAPKYRFPGYSEGPNPLPAGRSGGLNSRFFSFKAARYIGTCIQGAKRYKWLLSTSESHWYLALLSYSSFYADWPSETEYPRSFSLPPVLYMYIIIIIINFLRLLFISSLVGVRKAADVFFEPIKVSLLFSVKRKFVT